MGDLTRNFSRSEFACRCCCWVEIDFRLVTSLQTLRDLANAPIRVTSGYRCSDHNRAVGGAKHSLHLSGRAADIVIAGLSVVEMYMLAGQVPPFRNGGIGIYPLKGFIHVDIRDRRSRWRCVGGEYSPLG